MAEPLTIARPYAEAVFKLASEKNAFREWSEMLQWMATVSRDPDMAILIGNPKLSAADMERLYLDISGDKLNEDGRNLIQVLAQNRRLSVLPQIRELFEELKREREGVVEATVWSAFPLEAPQLQELVQYLEGRFERKVQAHVEVDRELIGGVKIAVGDVVIDGSVRGGLDNMALALTR
jgi:F-type H+-transporting ATPase subunit delta